MAKKEKKSVDPNERIGIGKFWAWESRELSDAAIVFLVGYISLFCTDVIKVNPLVVGTVLMITKLIDGVTDILAGYIVDRTNTRWGKGRPYDFCLIGTWGTLILLFACPTGWSDVAKIAWVAVFYILSNAVFTTFLNAGENVFMLRAFNKKQIIRFTSFGGIAMSLGGLLTGIIVPQMINHAGDDPKKWISAVAAVGVPLALIGMCRFLFIRERDDLVHEDENAEKVTLREIATLFRKNRYITLFCAIALINNIGSNIGIGTYYFKWVLGDLGVQSIFAAFSALGVIALVILPKVMKKFTVKQILIAGLLVSIVNSFICFLFYKNIPIMVACYVITTIANLPSVYISGIIMFDNADYNEYLGLHRMEGTMGAVRGFMGRIGSAVGVFLMGVILTVIRYDEAAAVQSDFTLTGLRVCMWLLPVVFTVLQLVLWNLYNIEKELPEVHASLEAKRAAQR
ncbi:MAG: MFS transporter [Ruminococcus flavefaciens]|nr:MFS transporter [Ruminococcus flavefaciens]